MKCLLEKELSKAVRGFELDRLSSLFTMLEEAKVEPRRSENVVVESTAKALAGQATTANAAAKNSSQGI